MLYRVAEFEKTPKGQKFKRFKYCGYKLLCGGQLYKGDVKANTTDKRKSNYCELNLGVSRPDINGVNIYERDLVYDKREKLTGVIRYDPKKGAFMMFVKNGIATIPYSFLDCYDVSLEVLGNEYEHEAKNKLFKRY